MKYAKAIIFIQHISTTRQFKLIYIKHKRDQGKMKKEHKAIWKHLSIKLKELHRKKKQDWKVKVTVQFKKRIQKPHIWFNERQRQTEKSSALIWKNWELQQTCGLLGVCFRFVVHKKTECCFSMFWFQFVDRKCPRPPERSGWLIMQQKIRNKF